MRIADGVRANGVGAEYPTAAIAGGFMRVWVSLATAQTALQTNGTGAFNISLVIVEVLDTISVVDNLRTNMLKS